MVNQIRPNSLDQAQGEDLPGSLPGLNGKSDLKGKAIEEAFSKDQARGIHPPAPRSSASAMGEEVNGLNEPTVSATDEGLEEAPSPTELSGRAGEERGLGVEQSGMWQSSGLLPESSAQAMEKRSWLSRWFWNLPIGRKQLLAMIICELVPILGLGVGMVWIITSNLRQQLAELAEAEVEIAGIEYEIKMNQMAFGSRGQSDNSALINAALDHREGLAMSPSAEAVVQQILGNEIQARNIEYATLVGADLRIVASANNDRAGETFDPNGLVSEVFENPLQIKASEVLSWSELEKEGSPLLNELQPQKDVLIRYVVTPVFDPENADTAVGALVFGDVVNGKYDIPSEVLSALDQGYSAVYQQDEAGDFSLSTSLLLGEGQDLEAAVNDVPLDTGELLQLAAESPGQTFVERRSIEGETYTVAVRSAASRIYTDYSSETRRNRPEFDSEQTHAILVHGAPETSLNQLLRRSLSQELLVLCLSAGLITLWSLLFRRTVLKPLQNLGLVTQAFAEGDRESRAEVEAYDEVGQLAMGFNDMADNIVASEQSLADEAQRQQLQADMARQLNSLTTQMRASLAVKDIFPIAVNGVRDSLAADRVVIYQFDGQGSGTIAAESVLPGWRSIKGQEVADPCFTEQYVEQYRQGQIHVFDNIATAGLEQCYLDELEPFEVQANLVVPIVTNDELIGLLCIHQCHEPRAWQESETRFAQQAAVQLGYALEQAGLSKAQQDARAAAEAASERERQENQKLQMQLIELLSDVENVADGDLTVRANVSEGAIGTVADFFNSIVESLRQLVTQVQVSSLEVNHSVGSSEGEIRQLTQEALRQSEELETALQSVEKMAQSIQAVATSAGQAAQVSQAAADTALAGGQSMDRTVDNILTLRETIGETAKKVKRLGESSQQISKVVYLINQIAMQTNLLAINAGIEAARAGEQGQGFAVVAEEVGELAARSATATKEIEQIVTNIQRETNEVVQAMELGTSQVVEGTQVVEEAKQNLGQIVTVSQEINALVKSISDTTVVQADTSQSITDLMQKLSAIAQRTSASSTQVSDSLQATVKVAQDLQESVGTFKVA